MKRSVAWTIWVAATLLAVSAWAGDDEHRRRSKGARAALTPVPDGPALRTYREECGACHLAYPPGLLPARSWTRLLDGLEDHFGQNAEVDPATRAQLDALLTAYGAEANTHPRSRKVLRSVAQATPLRISALPYILRKHDELRAEVWTRPGVVSRSNCGACHGGAEQWAFSEHDVRIPPR